ncbi:hypothetical protein [Actinomyces sp. MRS3W]|uniref:hypothetical protein n=1 Tax=Actinomyces sp. MRS3W TaxID=2800796 RepID=UPI0028FD7B7B|nr:hypothetical protein [Actinomyces sp. MRS3W]MDU0349092.1 hypothetical protein [Actinomyces sp. MRS3W]
MPLRPDPGGVHDGGACPSRATVTGAATPSGGDREQGYPARRLPLLAAVAALALALTACTSPSQRQAQDNRFAEFTEYVPEQPTVQTSVDSVTSRMPAIAATEAHFVGQYRVDEGESQLPAPDRPYWFHAVVNVDPTTSQALDDAATTTPALLPPIHPDLYQYVPQQCAFVTVPGTEANRILDTEHAELDGESERFTLNEVALSVDCDLVILIGTGNHS